MGWRAKRYPREGRKVEGPLKQPRRIPKRAGELRGTPRDFHKVERNPSENNEKFHRGLENQEGPQRGPDNAALVRSYGSL